MFPDKVIPGIYNYAIYRGEIHLAPEKLKVGDRMQFRAPAHHVAIPINISEVEAKGALAYNEDPRIRIVTRPIFGIAITCFVADFNQLKLVIDEMSGNARRRRLHRQEFALKATRKQLLEHKMALDKFERNVSRGVFEDIPIGVRDEYIALKRGKLQSHIARSESYLKEDFSTLNFMLLRIGSITKEEVLRRESYSIEQILAHTTWAN